MSTVTTQEERNGVLYTTHHVNRFIQQGDSMGGSKGMGNAITEVINYSYEKFPSVGKFIILNFKTMETFKNELGQIKYYDSSEEAITDCGMYELHACTVLEIVCNHFEEKYKFI